MCVSEVLISLLGFVVCLSWNVWCVDGFAFVQELTVEQGVNYLEPYGLCTNSFCLVVYSKQGANSNNREIVVRRSSNNGQSFGNEIVVSSPGTNSNPRVACANPRCMIVWKNGNKNLVSSFSSNSGGTWAPERAVLAANLSMSSPDVACFFDGGVGTCEAGAVDLITRDVLTAVTTDGNSFSPQTIQDNSIFLASANAFRIDCLNGNFCVGAIGGSDGVFTIRRPLQGGAVSWSQPQKISSSSETNALQGTIEAQDPAIAIQDGATVIVSHSTRRGTGAKFRIETALSTNSGGSFNSFQELAADGTEDLIHPAVSCFSSTCGVVWDSASLVGLPQFSVSTDRGRTYSTPAEFQGLEATPVAGFNGKLYEKIELTCFSAASDCLAFFEGEGFVQNRDISKSVVIASLKNAQNTDTPTQSPTKNPNNGDDSPPPNGNENNANEEPNGSSAGPIVGVLSICFIALGGAVLVQRRRQSSDNPTNLTIIPTRKVEHENDNDHPQSVAFKIIRASKRTTRAISTYFGSGTRPESRFPDF